MSTTSVSAEQLKNLEESLLNTSGNVPLHNRFRSLFTLKSLKSEQAVQIISKGFQDPSALLKHELAYCLGQTKKTSALPVLEAVLRDANEDPMVRHEAAEAMGAISSVDSIPILKEFLNDPERAVRETCEIALDRIKWDQSEEGRKVLDTQADEEHIPSVFTLTFFKKINTQAVPLRLYTSIDPAPATSKLIFGAPKPEDVTQDNIDTLRSQLLDTKIPLFERYRAMFALRNIGSAAAVDALAAGFSDDSALFKHEIAFVFGQLLSPHSVPALLNVLRDSKESDMVRHEAAEALGGIGTPEVLPHITEWMNREDSPQVVKESCQVAVDMWEYENSGDFQYANGLESAPAQVVAA
ncbi:deoxyhypusine hydroxylase [Marasmius tenuissimus]|nr:deoxyhypusine hydroxylase [Marasmius tenuissimus]